MDITRASSSASLSVDANASALAGQIQRNERTSGLLRNMHGGSPNSAILIRHQWSANEWDCPVERVPHIESGSGSGFDRPTYTPVNRRQVWRTQQQPAVVSACRSASEIPKLTGLAWRNCPRRAYPFVDSLLSSPRSLQKQSWQFKL